MPIDPNTVKWDDKPAIDPASVKWDDAPPAQGVMDRVLNQPITSLGGLSPRGAFNMGVGALRGAKDVVDVGAHGLASLADKVTGGNEAGRIRALDKTGVDQYNAAVGSTPEAMIGRLGGQAAITAPIGGVLGQGARLLGAGPKIVNALASNGFSIGGAPAATMGEAAGNLAIRSGASGLDAFAQAGAVDPKFAPTAGAIGLALPGAMLIGGKTGGALADVGQGAAERLMQSAIKPTLKQKQTGDAATAVRTLLDYGINPTKGGVEKLNGLIGDLNDQVSSKIAGSDATVDPQKVVNALGGAKKRFGNQVDPMGDLNAISGVQDRFLAGPGAGPIPVQLAQDMKKGTYQVLRDKYGQMGSAETEAQKGLARGLKDEISAAVPEVAPLNAEQSRLISTLNVTERRAMMDVNKNPLGLAALAVHEPTAFVAFMADKSALFKSLAARAINAVSEKAPPALNALAGPAAYRALPRSGRQQP